MKRKDIQKLLEWKKSPLRKPLVFQGARQVGKTYLILEFGRLHFKNIAYFNFEAQKDLQELFSESMNPEYLLPYLEQISQKEIIPGETLIVFDEVQTCERALTSLKYWNETHNQYFIIAAGSLLGVAVNRSEFSYPVGKVDEITMHPMDFSEFLVALGKSEFVELIKLHIKSSKKMPSLDHKAIFDLFYLYLAVGGMPECVSRYIQTSNFSLVREAQSNILHDYLADMSKYNKDNETKKVHQVFDSATVQLSKENTRFQMKLVKKGARAAEFENAIEWLALSGILIKVNAIDKPWKPLENYKDIDRFKLYIADTGLLCAMKDIDFADIIYGFKDLEDFKGGLVENYICNQLIACGIKPYFWESNRSAEIDFVVKTKPQNIEQRTEIIPIEVKSADNTKAKSLKVYCAAYKPKTAVKFSTKNFGLANIENTKIKILPLYSAGFTF